jgi:hypothetical protein
MTLDQAIKKICNKRKENSLDSINAEIERLQKKVKGIKEYTQERTIQMYQILKFNKNTGVWQACMFGMLYQCNQFAIDLANLLKTEIKWEFNTIIRTARPGDVLE